MKYSRYSRISQLAAALSALAFCFPVSGYAADDTKQGDAATGAKVWAENCGRCHNIRDARELRDDQWTSTMFHMRMRAGLTGQETRDAWAFLTSSNNPHRETIISGSPNPNRDPDVASLDAGVIYEQTCVACHGSDGKGTLPGAPDFTSTDGPLSKSDEALINSITYGFQGPGSPMAMPAKGGKSSLTGEDIELLLEYMKEQFSP